MYFYIVFYLVHSSLYFISRKVGNKVAFVFILLFSFLIGFRSIQTRIDTSHYYQVFMNPMANYFSDGNMMEHGYIHLNILFADLGFSFSIFQFILLFVSLLVSYIYLKGVIYDKRIFFYLIFCFVFIWSLQVYRQAVASFIVFPALYFILAKRIAWYFRIIGFLLFCLLAINIHYSVFVILLFAFAMIDKNFTKKQIFVLTVFCFVFGLFSFPLIKYFMQYTKYATSSYISISGYNAFGVIAFLLPDILFFFYVLKQTRRLFYRTRIFKVYMLAVFLRLFTLSAPLGDRVFFLFLLIVPFVLSNAIRFVKNKKQYLIFTFIYGLLKFAYYYLKLDGNVDKYNFIFLES